MGMPDAEMNAILEASCGVKDCTITAQALFHAATSTYKTVWLSVREETRSLNSRRPHSPKGKASCEIFMAVEAGFQLRRLAVTPICLAKHFYRQIRLASKE